MTMLDSAVLQLRLERVIRAPRERVFEAWTRAEDLERWSAPVGMTTEGGRIDLRVGGEWGVAMLERDGTRHEAFGRYLEVTPPSKLVYTHAWRAADGGSSPETILTVEFIAEGTKATRVVLTQVGFMAKASRDGHTEGWSSTLDRLEAMFAEGA